MRRGMMAAALAAGSALLLLGGVVPGLSEPLGDFANYHTASRVVLQGEPLEESYRDFLWFQKRIEAQGTVGQLGGFVPHPPAAALVLVPLAGWSPLAAKRVWTLSKLLLLAACIYWTARLAGLALGETAVLFLLTGPALWNDFAFGQLYLPLLASLAGCLYAERRGYPLLAGAVLGLLVPVKYVGAPWLLYFAWRGKWKLVLGGLGAALAVGLATLLLTGPEPFLAYWDEVLPRHLRGEIQNPYAVGFQSWNSLLRRLLVHEPLLNPQPLTDAPLLFAGASALVFGLTVAWAAAGVLAGDGADREARDCAWLLTLTLLASPAGATYHYLLLVLPAAVLVGRARRQGRHGRAFLLWVLAAAVHLPLYPHLEPLAGGLLNLLAFPRLWALLAFAAAAFHVSRAPLSGPRRWLPLLAGTLALGWGLLPAVAHPGAASDGAEPVPVQAPGADPLFGLMLREPHAAAGGLVFTGMEGARGRYAPLSPGGSRRAGEVPWSLFSPRSSPDGRRLLVESWHAGRPRIGLSEEGAPPRAVGEGSDPVWLGDGRCAFVDGGVIRVHDTRSGQTEVLSRAPDGSEALYDLSASSNGALVVRRRHQGRDEFYGGSGTSLQFRLAGFESPVRSLALSPDGRRLAFSWLRDGNWDLWVLDLSSRRRRRVTRHPGVDTDPAWVSEDRLVFASDRGRGLLYTTLYTLSVPPPYN